MNTFDEIRSFNDDEINAALTRLCDEKQFINIVSTVYPLMPKDVIKQKLKSYTSSYQFQKGMVFPFLKNVEANLSKGIELHGLELIERSTPYLYISNHRDIVLDPALLCLKLIENEMDTVEVAVGDNLLLLSWIKDIVRVNRSFLVKRGVSARQIFESSRLLSAYIQNVISEKRRSIWLAQREGRSKNADDRTQESLLKMLNMNGQTPNVAE
ncbi:MAG: 1-acyl-sn-glycerol-3-phosphate acyltransferase, partial [Paludibacter sp.]|nr:1-acyl-sn-glycerol-3-phosphate acyltransferase [Paludibacter sp.]